MIERNVRWVIDHRAVYDFCSHPSVLYVEDPDFRAIDLVCRLVGEAGDRAAIVDMDTIALRAKMRHRQGCPATATTVSHGDHHAIHAPATKSRQRDLRAAGFIPAHPPARG